MSYHKLSFRQIASNPENMGRIIHQRYNTVKDGVKYNTWSPIPPIESGMRCGECGLSVWNATNFSCPIHFCPDRVVEVELTDYFSKLGR